MRRVVTTLFLVLSSHSALAYLDADNLDQAAAMIYAESGFVEGTRKICGEYFPEQKRIFDYYALVWADKNRSETEGVSQYVAAMEDSESFRALGKVAVESGLAIVKGASTITSKESVCLSFLEDIKTGERNVAVRTPRASQLLRAYLDSHPLPPIDVDKRNMTSGCVKQSFNKKIDFDVASSTCACVTDTMYREMTPSELKEFDQLARKKADVSSFPPLVRAMPKLAACQYAGP